jgi:general stress protein CsbA
MQRHITEASWRKRETDLVWGAPMVLFAALAIAPVTISLVLEPAFPHARVAGILMLPLLAASIASGIGRLASCFQRDFDVLTLFAGGTIVALMVIAMATGVILASVVANL